MAPCGRSFASGSRLVHRTTGGSPGRFERSDESMSESTPLTFAHARHLLRRSGFGAKIEDAQDLLDRFGTRGAAADHLLDFEPTRFKPGGRYTEDIHNKWVKY